MKAPAGHFGEKKNIGACLYITCVSSHRNFKNKKKNMSGHLHVITVLADQGTQFHGRWNGGPNITVRRRASSVQAFDLADRRARDFSRHTNYGSSLALTWGLTYAPKRPARSVSGRLIGRFLLINVGTIPLRVSLMGTTDNFVGLSTGERRVRLMCREVRGANDEVHYLQ